MKRFIEQKDYYFDTETGLKWSLENFDPMTWDEAMILPTVEELLSITDNISDASIPATDLPGIKALRYWSSIKYTKRKNCAWYINFDHGNATSGPISEKYNIRLVRLDKL